MKTPPSLRKCWLCRHWDGDQKRGRGWCEFDKRRMTDYLDTCDKWKSIHGEKNGESNPN